MAVATEEKAYVKESAELVKALSSGPKLLADLPKDLQDAEFLAYMLDAKRIELGRPDHSWEPKQGASENAVDRPQVLKVQSTISWTRLDQPWHKTIYDFLAEDAEIDKALRIRVRLTHRR